MDMDVMEDLKAAARRMSARLSESGHDVPHTLVLEGLASALGVRNYRTLRARLGNSEKPELPRWVVHYSLGPAGDGKIDVNATSALQAVVRAQLELEIASRKEGRTILPELQVLSVVDVVRELSEAPYHPSGWDIPAVGDALVRVVGLSASVLSQMNSVSEDVAIAQVFLEQFFASEGSEYATEISAFDGRKVEGVAKQSDVLLRAFGLSTRVQPSEVVRTLTTFLFEQTAPANGKPWVALDVEEQIQLHVVALLPELLAEHVDKVLSEESEVSATCAVPELPQGIAAAPVTWARVLSVDSIFETPTGYVVDATC